MDLTNTYFIARRFFIRFIGVIYFIAFASAWVQIEGLVGSKGILPAQEYLAAARDFYGWPNFFALPTIFWINCSDFFMVAVCFFGMMVAGQVVAGVYPAIGLAIMWMLYLSIVHVGQAFMSFQWDTLLLEVGFLSIFLSPWDQKLNTFDEPPPRWVMFAMKLLLMKVMFQSGLVKVLSGDENWLDLTALSYHYYTQPLPNLTAWHLYQQPFFVHEMSCLIMFIVELVVPFGMFLQRDIRLWSCSMIMLLQAAEMLTGNYGFYNLLIFAMCFLLMDDKHFRRKIYDKTFASWGDIPDQVKIKDTRLSRLKDVLCQIVVGLVISLTFLNFVSMKSTLPQSVDKIAKIFRPYLISNSYGLFANMTTERTEIVIEGSNDGYEWKTYEFKYKPGNIFRAPRQVAPHQPRLDWQMWFAALMPDYRYTPWFSNLLKRLLEGEQSVISLFFVDPFFGDPPTYIRAKAFTYEFSNKRFRKKTDQFWIRSEKGYYAPIMQLDQ
ncbi:MAG: lipase maturation factor family protein [Candidatus Omnitrophica bacterium]|nr:lipase maturation factor family protein [Candidatus Omnitrophota bacterium]